MKKLTQLILLYLFLLNSTAAQDYKVDGKIHFVLEDRAMLLPSKDVKFAKKIVDYKLRNKTNYEYKIKRKRIVGKSEETKRKDKKNHLVLATDNYVVFKFGKNAIRDVNGADIYVFTEDKISDLQVSISKDNKEWVDVGKVTQSKKYINLSGRIPYGKKYSYLRIKSMGGEDTNTKVRQVAAIKSHRGELGIKTKIIDGIVYTKSDQVSLQIYDFRQFDGDQISVKVNGKVISKRKLLTKWNRFVPIHLKEGENEIVVRAKTEGYLKPNTIDLKIVDGIKINIGSYRIRKNRTKTITIIKTKDQKPESEDSHEDEAIFTEHLH